VGFVLVLLASLVTAASRDGSLVASILGLAATLERLVARVDALAASVIEAGVGTNVHAGHRVVDHATLGEAYSRQPQHCRKRNEGEAPAKARVAVIDVHRGP